MIKSRFSMIAACVALLIFITGCGGSSDSTPGASAAPTKVVVKLSTEGTLQSGIGIGTIKVTASLPAGLSVKGKANSTNPAEIDIDTSSLTITGVAASKVILTRAAYTPATNTVLIDILCPSLTGLGVGEFAVVQCDIAADASPSESAIQITSTKIGDTMGNPLTGISVTYSSYKQ